MSASIVTMPVVARIANEFLDTPTRLSFDPVLVSYLVGCRWWLRLDGFVPPPVGALAGGPGTRRDGGRGLSWWARERSRAQWSPGAVGDAEIVGGSGDGDDAPVVQPMVIRAYQHQVGQFGQTAILPVPDVVCA